MALNTDRFISIYNLAKQAFGRYKPQIIILTVLGFIGGIVEGIGVNALVPLLSQIAGKASSADDIISQTIRQFFNFLNIDFSVKQILVFIIILFIIKAFVLILFNYIKVKITADYEEITRNDLFSKTIRADWPYLLKQKIGYLENVLLIDVQFSAGMLRQISTSIMSLTSLLIYIIIAINISFQITLITLIVGGALFLCFKPLIYKTKIIAHYTTRINKQISHFVNQNIIGIKTVKLLLVHNKIIELGKEYFARLKKYRIKITIFRSITNSLIQPITIIFICIIFAISYKTASFELASFVAVIYLIQRIFQYVQQLQLNLHKVNESIPYLKNVQYYQNKAQHHRELDNATGKLEFKKELEFNNIDFSYNGQAEVLSEINFKVNKGELVGIVGPSGVGKTTIADLLLRLFKLNKGKILLDGKDIDKINLKQWRNKVIQVPQDIFLINDTIANNIRFYDDIISQNDIAQAAKEANIYDFIDSLPDKFNSQIGERGVLLSHGQRQRIVIARALARDPEILIFDEATSALDNESEVKIQQVIENLKGRITTIVIAHRMSTIINCDKIIALENGSIVEQGPPNELLKDKNSYFYKVYNIRK